MRDLGSPRNQVPKRPTQVLRCTEVPNHTIISDHDRGMPTGADLGPDLAPSTCHVCGEPAGLEYWIDDRRWAVHTKCRDWTKLPFVFARQLKALRRRRGEPGVGEVLAWLEGARRRWPEGAVEIVEVGQEQLRRVGVW